MAELVGDHEKTFRIGQPGDHPDQEPDALEVPWTPAAKRVPGSKEAISTSPSPAAAATSADADRSPPVSASAATCSERA